MSEVIICQACKDTGYKYKSPVVGGFDDYCLQCEKGRMLAVEKEHQCALCTFKTQDEKAFAGHYDAMHRDSPRLERKVLDRIVKHVNKAQIMVEEFSCSRCSYIALNQKAFDAHIVEEHGAKMVEQVDHPAHYGGADNPYEAIKVIEALNFNFNTGNAFKYLARAGKKPGVSAAQDLKKAIWYLTRELHNVESGTNTRTD